MTHSFQVKLAKSLLIVLALLLIIAGLVNNLMH